MVFEPYLNTSTDNAPVTDGQWQTWNTVSGKWWLTKPALFNNACAQSSPCTWNELTSQFPNMGINGGVNQQILFKAGSGWTSDFIGNVDALTVSFGSTGDTYDFEPYQTPTDANQCKKDGYKAYRDNTGMKFDNQGQCVSWVQHNVNGNGNGASNQSNSQTQ